MFAVPLPEMPEVDVPTVIGQELLQLLCDPPPGQALALEVVMRLGIALNTEFCWLINFAEQSINFVLAYSTQQTDVGKFLDGLDALHGRILKNLNTAKIELALPIQTIQLKGEGLINQQQIKPGS